MSGFLFAVVPIVLIVGYALYKIVNRGLEMKALCHRGMLGMGRVTQNSSYTSGSGRRYYLSYELTLPDGRSFTHRMAASSEEAARWSLGSTIEVVYLPERPAVSGSREMVNQARKALRLPSL